MLASIPPLVFPSANDAVGLIPVLVLAGGFVVLMLLDLWTPASRRAGLAAVALAVIAAAFVAVVWGWFDIGSNGARSVYFGAFAYDRFAMFVDGLLLVAAGLTVIMSPQYLNRRGIHFGEYYSLILAATTGMMLLAGAASLMVIFLGVELLSIALYVLSGFSREEEHSQEAGLKYLLLGGFASGFLLYGMALVYGETGHTQLQLIAYSLSTFRSADPLLAVGIGMIFVGLAFKVSAAPFHTWTPDVYQGAPTSVTAFMSVATKVAAFAAIIRLFNVAFLPDYSEWFKIVTAVAILSMLWGNVAALVQTSLKRMLAYSGVAQAGYILIGVAIYPVAGTSGGLTPTLSMLFYLAAYTLTNLGAFAVITVMAGRGEDLDSYDSIRGLGRRRPYVAAAMSLFMLSLAGFPPTAGFFAKFLIFSSAIQSSQVMLAIWGILTSMVSVFYYLRVVLLMYSKPEGETVAAPYPWPRTSAGGALVLLTTAGGTLAMGIFVAALYGLSLAAQ